MPAASRRPGRSTKRTPRFIVRDAIKQALAYRRKHRDKMISCAATGTPIYRRRCAQCKFLFTDAFDDWSIEQFMTHIYNDEYELVDPDYRLLRPRANADVVGRLWGAIKAGTRSSHYGGGNVRILHRVFRDAGFPEAVTFTRTMPEHATRPEGNLIWCKLRRRFQDAYPILCWNRFDT